MEAVGKNYGQVEALQDISLDIRPGELFGLIGPDGAGKTTLFRILTTLLLADKGTATVCGLDVVRDYKKIRTMVGYMPGRFSLYQDLTVEENVKVAMHNSMSYSMLGGMLRLPKYWHEERVAHERAIELLSIFEMECMADFKASSLPYGAQRRLEIVRALATNPSLLLLDEPAAGMNPSETADLMNTIRRIRDTFGIAIILIEHDMNLVMGVCEGIAVLNFGRIIAKGTPDEIRSNPAVIEAYLGQSEGE